MARQYSRREFLTDASFAFGSSVLLKVLSPKTADPDSTLMATSSEPAITPKQGIDESTKKG